MHIFTEFSTNTSNYSLYIFKLYTSWTLQMYCFKNISFKVTHPFIFAVFLNNKLIYLIGWAKNPEVILNYLFSSSCNQIASVSLKT